MSEGSTKLKILHILDHSLPLHSGYAFRSHNILLAQLKRGWQPLVVTSPKHEMSLKGESQEQNDFDGCVYLRTPPMYWGHMPFINELLILTALAKRIWSVAKRHKPDLLHAHSPILNGIPALWVGRMLGIPVVYEIRALWEDAATNHGTYTESSWKYKLVKRAETWVSRKADQVVTICEGLKLEMIQRGISPKKMGVVFNGVDLQNFIPSEPDSEFKKVWGLTGKKVIGFIGSFYGYEGLDLLVEAIAQVNMKKPDLLLVLVGGGMMEEKIRAQIQRLHLEKAVVMPGRIPHHRIPGVYALIDLFVYPRYSIPLTELVTPLKPLEAMAMGKALLASDIGGHRELIQDRKTGILFKAGDLNELRHAIEWLIEDESLRLTLGRQGKLWVSEKHSWDKTTAVYSEIYSRALGKNLQSCTD